MLTNKQLKNTLEEMDYIINLYKEKYVKNIKEQRDWRTYEQRVAKRIREAASELKPLVEEAYSLLKVDKPKRGRKPKLTPVEKVLVLLIKEIFNISNRKMANMLLIFSLLTNYDVSYKTVERCYSDKLVKMIIHNLYILLMKKKGIDNVDASGDATGYSLTISKHYRTEKWSKNKGKESKKAFAYAFALMDLKTKFYIAYGVSLKSEKDAYNKALSMLSVNINSIRLDRYYFHQSIVESLPNVKHFYIMPKKNATLNGSIKWKNMLKEFVSNPILYLKEYFRRNNSESGFSADKRFSGWKVNQRKEETIETALLCKGAWHNLLLLG